MGTAGEEGCWQILNILVGICAYLQLQIFAFVPTQYLVVFYGKFVIFIVGSEVYAWIVTLHQSSYISSTYLF